MKGVTRVFGQRAGSVRVRIQEMENGRPTRTVSFAVLGEDFDDVEALVQSALAERYTDNTEEDEEPEPAPPVKKKVRRVR